MEFYNEILMRGAIFVLGFGGFLVAWHIYKHKKADKPLICLVGFDCNFVTHSGYSQFMHIPLEIFGMIYYALLSVSYLYFIFVPENLTPVVSSIFLIASLGTFLFSLYLLCVQLFILKKGCSWCIVSAIISILIFVLTCFSYDFSLVTQIF